MAGKKRKMATITDLIFQVGRKYEKGKNKYSKSKTHFVCPECGKILRNEEDFCECSNVIIEIEIKKVIIKERKRKRKIRGE
jgi:hypothetical protein